jgi:hypothetical protein
MIVSGIKWMSVEGREAAVTITDGSFTCETFCHPCWVNVGDRVYEPLHILSVKYAFLSRDSEVGIWNIKNLGMSKKVIAQLEDVEQQILLVGQIALVADYALPGGVKRGDIIELECGRIDLW